MEKSRLDCIKREAKQLSKGLELGLPKWTTHTINDLLSHINELENKQKKKPKKTSPKSEAR